MASSVSALLLPTSAHHMPPPVFRALKYTAGPRPTSPAPKECAPPQVRNYRISGHTRASCFAQKRPAPEPNSPPRRQGWTPPPHPTPGLPPRLGMPAPKSTKADQRRPAKINNPAAHAPPTTRHSPHPRRPRAATAAPRLATGGHGRLPPDHGRPRRAGAGQHHRTAQTQPKTHNTQARFARPTKLGQKR